MWKVMANDKGVKAVIISGKRRRKKAESLAG
jgi:hypothetical protein